MSAPVAVAGSRVGVIGLARSGRAVARLLASRGASVYASDLAGGDELARTAERLRALGVEAETGGHDPGRLAACDWVVVSPGVPPAAEVLGQPALAGKPAFGEVEVASWFAGAPIVAVTGTNGKTTTTALVGEIARAGGLDVEVAGNIGRAFSEAVLVEATPDWYVLEVSSFQLGRIERFRPRVAVVLNVSPDHLDTYPDLASYVADKRRIAANQGPGDDLCLSAEDPVLADFGAGRPVERLWLHRTAPVERGATAASGWIELVGMAGEGRLLPADRLQIPGAHNLQNALAAALAAARMGIAREAIVDALAAFRGVPHRLETVAVEDGVRWVNDSKATNVASAGVGLEAFDAPLVVILGGRHKRSSYAPLAAPLAARARRVLAIGETAPTIAAELGDVVEVEEVGTLERAVERARTLARPGDVVLLSPACSSYDQFTDFEERGATFKALVARRPVEEEVGR